MIAVLRHLFSSFSRVQVVRSGAAGLAVRILSVLAGLASSVVLARLLGPVDYGLYSYVLALLLTIAVPVQLGLPTLVVRETARARATEDWPLMRGAWSWATLVVILGSVIVTLGVLAWLWFGPEMDDRRRLVLLIGLPQISLLALAAVRGSALRGLKSVFMSIFPDQVLRPLLLMIFVLGVWMSGGSVSAAVVMSMYIVSSAVALVVGALALWRATPQGLRKTSISGRNTATWSRSLIPLSLIVGFNVLSLNTGLVMLGVMATDEDVAFFRIALSLSALAVFGLSVVNLFIQPYLAEAYAKSDFLQLQRLAAGGAGAAFAATIPVTVIIWFFGARLITTLYGPDYISALTPLLILLVGQTVSAFFGAVGSVLTMCGKENHNMRILFVSAGLNIVLNLMLIPIYGTIGAAVATAVSTTLVNTLMWRAAMKTIRINSSLFGLIWAKNAK